LVLCFIWNPGNATDIRSYGYAQKQANSDP
jgi:hypothetical protein